MALMAVPSWCALLSISPAGAGVVNGVVLAIRFSVASWEMALAALRLCPLRTILVVLLVE
jgi:hypothetical protein